MPSSTCLKEVLLVTLRRLLELHSIAIKTIPYCLYSKNERHEFYHNINTNFTLIFLAFILLQELKDPSHLLGFKNVCIPWVRNVWRKGRKSQFFSIPDRSNSVLRRFLQTGAGSCGILPGGLRNTSRAGSWEPTQGYQ